VQEVGPILYTSQQQYNRQSFGTERVGNGANRCFVAGILTEISLLLVFRAILASQQAIKDANTHATTIKKYNDFGNDGDSTAVTAFGDAVTKIKAAFEKYSVRTTLIVIGLG
jgi:hypothetical protein